MGGEKKERSSFEDRVFQETMEQYQARVADRCEAGKDCCALRVREAQDDFRGEISLLETRYFLGRTTEGLFLERF